MYSRFISQWAPDSEVVLSDSGQSPEEYVAQAVRERVERERKPKIPPWIADRYPGEKWPVLRVVRSNGLEKNRTMRYSMSEEQRADWDREFSRELAEERQENANKPPDSPAGQPPAPAESRKPDPNSPYLPAPLWEDDATPDLEEKILSVLRKKRIPVPTIAQYEAFPPERQQQETERLLAARERARQILDEYERKEKGD